MANFMCERCKGIRPENRAVQLSGLSAEGYTRRICRRCARKAKMRVPAQAKPIKPLLPWLERAGEHFFRKRSYIDNPRAL